MLRLKFIFLLFSTITVSACSSFGYYLDLMDGHSELMEHRKPVKEILAESKTKPELRKLLIKSQEIRDFASKSLDLPDNNSYRMYADLKRNYAVWNVVAAKEFSIKAKKWCFLFVGCLSYRGYFSKEAATSYANELKKKGYDVYVAGAKAYSTLGWFDDPLLNTMMYKSEVYRAGIIFHELAHQVVYIEDDSAFNEAFATAVEEEGIRRWLVKSGKGESYEKYIIAKRRNDQLNQLLKQTREKLEHLYQENISKEEKRSAKNHIFSHMKDEYRQLKKSWAGYAAFDSWMNQDLNNAHLLLIATYNDLVPSFKTILQNENNNLKRFYNAVESLANLNKEKRHIRMSINKLLANKNQ